jgi:HAD superfamily hydrolase (TIGR01509 family)
MIKAIIFDCFGVLTPEVTGSGLSGPNEPLLEFISTTLKQKYKIGMLSNADANWLEHIFTSEQLTIFDAIALSFEIGAMKPHPKTYLTIADRLKVDPSECVFIDDRQELCDGASQSGMRALLYKDADQIKKELGALLKI